MLSFRRLVATATVTMLLLATACAPNTGASAGSVGTPTSAAAPPAANTAAPATVAPQITPTAAPTRAPTAVPTATAGDPASTATAAATPASSPAATPATSATSGSTIRFDIVPVDTKASYRVREQLARLPAPSDAVGTTSDVAGAIVIGADGKIVSDQSKVTVQLGSLQSDSALRDRFIKGNTLNVSTYPAAEFVPTEVQGLPSPLPTSGQHTFQLVGNLTVHGVTRPVTWDVTSQVDGNDVTGNATTQFTFEDFGMAQPQVASVLSVADTIGLEMAFHVVRAAE